MSVRANFKKGFYFFSTDLLDDVTMGSNPIKGRLEWSVDGGRGFFSCCLESQTKHIWC